MLGATSHRGDTAAWRQFWTGREAGTEHRYRDPATHTILKAHWDTVFARRFAIPGRVRMLELACGEGEVSQQAGAFADANSALGVQLELFCTDIAPDALALSRARTGGAAMPVVADCGRLPFRANSVDLVVSQFGLEYAGETAFVEGASTLAPDGCLHAVVHCSGGLVETACRQVAGLLGAVADAGLFRCLESYTRVMPRVWAGENVHEEAGRCADDLRQALNDLAVVVHESGPGPARDHIGRLLADSRTLAGRLQAYSPADVAHWILVQSGEIDAFRHRMESMIRAARSDADMRAVCGRIQSASGKECRLDLLPGPDGSAPLAWTIEALAAGRAP